MTEGLVGSFLKGRFGANCEEHPKIPAPTRRALALDWRIFHAGRYFSIELDGNQHFKEVEFFGGAATLEATKARDVYKMLYSLIRGDYFIRIHQLDVLTSDRMGSDSWKSILVQTIENPPSLINYLEKVQRDSWGHLRRELELWPPYVGLLDAWLAQNGNRLEVAAAKDVASEDVDIDNLASHMSGLDVSDAGTGVRQPNQYVPAHHVDDTPPVNGAGRLDRRCAHTNMMCNYLDTHVQKLDADSRIRWMIQCPNIMGLLADMPRGDDSKGVSALAQDNGYSKELIWAALAVVDAC
jgi:hypothetical protein